MMGQCVEDEIKVAGEIYLKLLKDPSKPILVPEKKKKRNSKKKNLTAYSRRKEEFTKASFN